MGKKWVSVLIAWALLLSSCSALRGESRTDNQRNQRAETGHTTVKSDEEEMHMDTAENVIYLGGAASGALRP